jgi:putative membrane protein
LLIPPIVMALGFRPLMDAITAGGWTAAQASAVPGEVAFALTGYAVAQLILFAVVVFVVALPPVRRLVTPRFLKRHRVKKAAFHHFAAAHSHVRDSETGVLIFVALVERQVEVLADAAIHAKAGDAVWRDAAGAVQAGMRQPDPTAGIVEAIGICGVALKQYFPSNGPRAETHKPMDD